jgi:thioesterase III
MTEKKNEVFETEVLIRESLIDSFGHMNNSKYLELFEEARWEIINGRGFSVREIMKNGLGPVVLEVNLRFTKEIRLREKIRITSEVEASASKGKTMTMKQVMMNDKGEVCCTAMFVFGLFDLKARKLISPTPEWSRAIGVLE